MTQREEFEVWRATTALDEYNDPQPTAFSKFKTVEGLFAPSNPAEPLAVGSNTVIAAGVVYIRGTTPTGILSADRLKIRGAFYDVDGEVGAWIGKNGYKGDQLAVKAVKPGKAVT